MRTATLLRSLADSVHEDLLGQPVSLRRFLEDGSRLRVPLDATDRSIDASRVVQWHELGRAPCQYWPRRKLGTMMGWRAQGSSYGSFTTHRTEYQQLEVCDVVAKWSCDISEVDGLGASKSRLQDFLTTDAMVEKNSRSMIDPITKAKLQENLAHTEIRIIHAPGSDHFERYQWDGRTFLMNSGGSHHFSAAKYIASRIQERVSLTGKLCTYSLNREAVASLRKDFEMFVLPDDPETAMSFSDAMRAYRATWLWHHLPRPFEHARAILLPRNERRSMRVASLFAAAGVSDLGRHLVRLTSSTAAPAAAQARRPN